MVGARSVEAPDPHLRARARDPSRPSPSGDRDGAACASGGGKWTASNEEHCRRRQSMW
uniref:Uncharacterized protein n=1 Tax=Oryza sativa subsp. japonica TaxID=39947 RepID=Q6ZBQ0_ORYSJ|nr:hypothetical protein [Oryza sativa Japonica Group]